ncbi:unnamed protein product, partial [Didymodactylos carnosus]
CAIVKFKNKLDAITYSQVHFDPVIFGCEVQTRYSVVADTTSQDADDSHYGNQEERSDNCSCFLVKYGPATIKPRKYPALTLATGRRSKYDILSTPEACRRDIRRVRNRAAQRRATERRDEIHANLSEQVKLLEIERYYLENDIQHLNRRKLLLETLILKYKEECGA